MIGAASKPNFPGMFQRQQPVAGLNAPDQGGSVFCGINQVNARLVHRNRVEGCQDADIMHIRVKFSDFLVNSRFLPYQHYHFVVFSALFCCIFLLYVDCTAALNFSRLFLIGRIYLFNVVTKLLCPNIFCNSLSSTLGFK